MAGLKPKVKLAKKNEEAYVSVKQLMVTLRWTKDVDLDLMAFYKAKDGTAGGVFSQAYKKNDPNAMGNLNAFPFIQLSQDAGQGAVGGDNEEEIRITKLDDMAEVYIVTINYTDASKGVSSCFGDYDGEVVVADDKGESVGIPLTSKDPGNVALICKIDNTNPMGPKVINLNEIMDLAKFASTVPGANLVVH